MDRGLRLVAIGPFGAIGHRRLFRLSLSPGSCLPLPRSPSHATRRAARPPAPPLFHPRLSPQRPAVSYLGSAAICAPSPISSTGFSRCAQPQLPAPFWFAGLQFRDDSGRRNVLSREENARHPLRVGQP